MSPPAIVSLIFVVVVMATAEGVPLNASSRIPPQGSCEPKRFRNCQDHLWRSGRRVDVPDGVYIIQPDDSIPDRPVRVWCDMTTDGGGWTLIQRRGDYEEQEDFFRTWTEYRLGFGNVSKDHWLGLDHIHALTEQSLHELRIDLADFEGEFRWAKYDFFFVEGRKEDYNLTIGDYRGDAGDSLKLHNGRKFSTKDHDVDLSDRNCAETKKGAWWYERCQHSNLNGMYFREEMESSNSGVSWYHWRGHHYSLKDTTMKIRPRF